MTLVYIDCSYGASEDRLLGALIDAGADSGKIENALSILNVQGARIDAEPAGSHGAAGVRARVILPDSPGNITLENLKRTVERLPARASIRETLFNAFSRLQDAGATDEDFGPHDLVTLAAVALAMDGLGVEEIAISAIGFGQGKPAGSVELSRTRLVAKLSAGFSVFSTGHDVALVTPLAAAIITTAALGSGSSAVMPPMRLVASGCGIGGEEWPIPNALQLFVGEHESVSESDRVAIVETNIDDMTAQGLGHVMQVLLDRGALDVYFTPIQMKKNRPAVMLSVICTGLTLESCIDALLRETTTLGVRISYASRRCLARSSIEVETAYGAVSVKVALLNGQVRSVMPEYDDCHRLALAADVPLREVQDSASAAALDQLKRERG
ncbi:MAG TPA: LarC family nickel insertion protein [Armatimonadota bacterium]|nr:LarC family nickel insertion protein [Armatimonadota bacterium]